MSGARVLVGTKKGAFVLTSDGKRIQSFWFRFSDYPSNSLCLAFDGYQGVQLHDSKTARCKCK